MMMSNIDKIKIHTTAQQRAAQVLDLMTQFITVNKTEKEIVTHCAQLLIEHDLTETWYYTVPVLAYVGKRTTLSMSGREYQPTDTKIKNDDVTTIALSPKVNDCWAAIARTFIVQDGKVVVSAPHTSEYQDIIDFQHKIHNELLAIAKPEMRFEELYQHFNDFIQAGGYINLDYHGNLGHTLEKDLAQRRFIEKGSRTQLKDCDIFAVETHIGKAGAEYGSKYENIYYFENDKLIAASQGCLV